MFSQFEAYIKKPAEYEKANFIAHDAVKLLN